MKVGIKGKGVEIKWLEADELIVDNRMLKEHLKNQHDENLLLSKRIDGLNEQISKLIVKLESVKLENIEVIKGVISR